MSKKRRPINSGYLKNEGVNNLEKNVIETKKVGVLFFFDASDMLLIEFR
jgi:hypothetical protein